MAGVAKGWLGSGCLATILIYVEAECDRWFARSEGVRLVYAAPLSIVSLSVTISAFDNVAVRLLLSPLKTRLGCSESTALCPVSSSKVAWLSPGMLSLPGLYGVAAILNAVSAARLTSESRLSTSGSSFVTASTLEARPPDPWAMMGLESFLVRTSIGGSLLTIVRFSSSAWPYWMVLAGRARACLGVARRA